MTTFQIKIIAICAMVIDHLSLFIFKDILILRIIGRIAFPLFAWLVANGTFYTKNINKYLIRLLVFAAVSQLPYMLLFKSTNLYLIPLNALFTLSLGLAAIISIKSTKSLFLKIIFTMVYALTANILNMDYGVAGVLSVVAFYIFFNNIKMLIISQAFIYTLLYFFSALLANLITKVDLSKIVIEPFAVLSMLIIALYNFKEGKKMKYLFYWFYPVHLFLVYLIKILLT